MKRLVLGAAVVAAIAAAGCDSIFPPEKQEFVIKIDSVTGPTAVSGGASFDQFFWGSVGYNGCFRFKEFRVTRTSSSADVTVIGEFEGPAECTQAAVTLNGQALTFTPPTTNPFAIRVHQPDGTVLPRTIHPE